MNSPALPYQPFQFGPSDASLFGWFHPPAGPSRATGVVLCNPIGDDYVRAHRAFRHLAERLSRAGFSVLRFDFRGTGDSSGSERDPKRVEAWLEDVGLAVAELRARSGAKHVALAGLKLGATLAMVAAAQGPVDSLVLWSAYPTGAAYVNETTKLHQMHKLLEPRSFASEPSGWNGGGQEALGFLLTPETVADLGKLELLAVAHKPAAHTLIVAGANVPNEDKLLQHLRSLGSEPELRHAPGHKFLVQVPHKAEVPSAILDEIVAWLSERHPVDAHAPAQPAAKAAGPGDARYGEEPIVFGASHPLFGVLVHPPTALRDKKRPAIIMTNAGSIHRIGPHRFYVPMARRWAALGFTVLRMDLSGIGDSPAAPGCAENLTYPRDGLADLDEAMAAVTRATGAERFIVVGHCSGGDLAFQLGYHDRRVAGAVMINPRTFCVHDLAMVESYKRARYYQGSMFRLASWKKALRGDVDFRRALGMVMPKFTDLVKRRMDGLIKRVARGADGEELNDVPTCLRLMAERGVDTFLVATEKDPGVDYVDVQFGKAMESLKSVRGFRREDFLGTDHSFTSLYAQERVSQVLTDHLTAHHS